MNEFKIINFYTDNGIYSDMAKRLKESCKKFNIDCDIEKYKDLNLFLLLPLLHALKSSLNKL
jgi:hypothetical protein